MACILSFPISINYYIQATNSLLFKKYIFFACEQSGFIHTSIGKCFKQNLQDLITFY